MKKNIYDEALAGVSNVIEEVSSSIGSEFKNTNPFDKEPVSNDESLYFYENMAELDLRYLVMTYGEEAVNQRFYEMEQLKKRRGL